MNVTNIIYCTKPVLEGLVQILIRGPTTFYWPGDDSGCIKTMEVFFGTH